MKYLRFTIILIFTLFFYAPVFSQTTKTVKGNSFKGVTLIYLSQRCLPADKVPYVGKDIIDYSDMITRFRLENNSKEEIYFLTSMGSNLILPQGFVLFRKSKDEEWTSVYSPARGREGIFTGINFGWLGLPSGFAIEFESSGFSRTDGEHAGSVFLNTKPEQKGRVELISNEFVAVPCPKAKK